MPSTENDRFRRAFRNLADRSEADVERLRLAYEAQHADCFPENDDADDDEDLSYSPYGDPDGYDRGGAYDGFQVTSDAEGGL